MDAIYRPISPFQFEQNAGSLSNDYRSVEPPEQTAAQVTLDDAQVRNISPLQASNSGTQSERVRLIPNLDVASRHGSLVQSKTPSNDDHDPVPSQSTSQSRSARHVSPTAVRMGGLPKIHSPGPSKKQQTLSWRLWAIWKWELFTWLLGTIGLIANISLMIASNKKLLKDWKSNVQITAFVATLAQVSQSALLVPIASSIAQLKWSWAANCPATAKDIQRFDLASRGPDGSMRLLWFLSYRQYVKGSDESL